MMRVVKSTKNNENKVHEKLVLEISGKDISLYEKRNSPYGNRYWLRVNQKEARRLASALLRLAKELE